MTERKFKAVGNSTSSPIDNMNRKEIFIAAPKKLVRKLYWTFGEDECPVLTESRFYVDLNLHADTENYAEGEYINVTIKSSDGEQISHHFETMTISLLVGPHGKAKMNNIFAGKKIDLFSEEQV